MEFRILGPVEVVDEGRPVSIRRGKELAVLAYLLLHANEVVPSERLIDELWNERPPATAAKILQNAVSQLRKALGDDRLLTHTPGYLLRVDPGELDLELFEVLSERGRAARDPRLLRQALELWRGEALADLLDESFAQRASLRLEESRLATNADRLDADLADGRHAELVPELEDLIARHPLDERPYRQLMLALYRAGRPADALEVYRRARTTFDEELGLRPSSELDALQRSILNQDAALSAIPRPGPGAAAWRPNRRRTLPLIAGTLVGAAALTTLVLLLTNTGDGAPPVVKDSLVKVDPETGDVLDVIRVGRQPIALAVAGDFVWVSNTEEGTVMRVDPKSGQTDAIGGVRPPFDLVSDGPRHVWFSTYAYEQVTRIDTRALAPDLIVPLHHTTFLLGTGAGSLWVTEPASNPVDRGTVERINLKTTKVEDTFRVEAAPLDVKVGEGAAWVTNSADASVSRIDLEDGTVERIPIGSTVGPLAIAFGSLWITGPTRNTVWRLNPETRQVDDVIQLGGSPFNITADAHGLWVALREVGTIVRIDPGTNAITRKEHLGFKPQGLAVGAGALWVTVGHGQLGALG